MRRLPLPEPIRPSFGLLARLAASGHDLGKATAYFQEYLRSASHRRSSLTPHAHLSALLTYHLGRRLLDARGLGADLSASGLLLFATLAVARHHGHLEDLADDWREFVDFSWEGADEMLDRQWMAVDRTGLQAHASCLLSELACAPVSWEPPESGDLRFGAVRFKLRHEGKRLAERATFSEALAWRHLYSLLTGCDKLDAALCGPPPARIEALEAGLVQSFRGQAFAGQVRPLSALREAVFQEVRSGVARHAEPGTVFTLTAPTGSGKTLALLWAGLELRGRALAAGHPLPRIVYCLPFTSIVDQNFEVFSRVLGQGSADVRPDTLLRHHHLADFDYETEHAQFSEEQAELLVETWQSEVVVTTFYQFFHALFSRKNAEAKRFFRLAGSVLLLDEVQAIPRRYWELVRAALLGLARGYGVTIVLATATRPLVLGPGDAVELCPDPERHFSGLDRVTLRCRLEHPEALDDFAERLCGEVAADGADVLVIANTIGAARRLHARLREVVGPDELFYLSTHLTPRDRADRLKELTRGGDSRRVLVSTQLVEAGVDLSFDRVYRDLAPLDCIVQAAGRCNRSNEGPRGTVEVCWLEDPGRTRPWQFSQIYDPLLLEATRRVLPPSGEVAERCFFELTAAYFDEVRVTGADQELEAHLVRLEAGTVGRKFRLIEDDGPRQDYFVIRDEEDSSLWDRYQALGDEPERRARHRRFLSMKNDFYSRVIHVRCRVPPRQPVLPLYAAGCPEGRYDPATGYESAEGGTFDF